VSFAAGVLSCCVSFRNLLYTFHFRKRSRMRLRIALLSRSRHDQSAESFHPGAGQTINDINSNSSTIAWRSLRDRGAAVLCECACQFGVAPEEKPPIYRSASFSISRSSRALSPGGSFSMPLIIRSFLGRMRSSRMALGVITSTVIPQRRIQFALKLEF